MGWQPASIDDVMAIVNTDLEDCDPEQFAIYKNYAIKPFVAPIERYGRMESVVVVARNGNEVMYWEDVEEGFNISPISSNGRILEHRCSQDELKHALNAWMK
jgi:hypothetical protein